MTNGAADNACDCAACAGVYPVDPRDHRQQPGPAAHLGAHRRLFQLPCQHDRRLSDSSRPALAPLTARTPDDYSIAVLDAFAMVADILTFYQERFAQENSGPRRWRLWRPTSRSSPA